MNRRLTFLALGLLFLSFGGCKKKIGDEAAIRESIQKHLSGLGSINMAAMDTDIKQVTVNGDNAQADVEFRLKQGGATMQMTYALERHAGAWIVLKSQPAGGQFEHPPMDKTHSTMPAAAAGADPPNIHDLLKAAPPAAPKPPREKRPAAEPAKKTTP
jgi:hypothetical protein